jgi:peptidoglycan hydrolase-like protein with peptidoglycan-binding domain
MRIRTWKYLTLGVALVALPAFATRSHRAATAGHGKGSHHLKHVAALAHVIQGQRTIDSDRTREIQSALIERNYLTGTPSGEWDADTEAAMTKFQADHGWQTKLMPDSRALIKLGLGPNSLPGSAGDASSSFATSVPSSNEANTLATAHSIMN